MRQILIFRHTPDDGPGHLGDFLLRAGAPFRVVRVDEGDPIPGSPEGASGLVFMGGPQSANDPLPWIPQALALIREAMSKHIPVLGHCLGGQLMARALGAAVVRSSEKEIGWLPVRRVPARAAEEWFGGLPPKFDVFQWHWESFEIPAGAERLLESDGCRNQAFALGKSIALQCHIEMTGEMVREWARGGIDAPPEPPGTVQGPEEMLRDLDARVEALHGVADRVYRQWLSGLS